MHVRAPEHQRELRQLGGLQLDRRRGTARAGRASIGPICPTSGRRADVGAREQVEHQQQRHRDASSGPAERPVGARGQALADPERDDADHREDRLLGQRRRTRCRPRRSPSRWSPRRPWSGRSAAAGRRWTAAGSTRPAAGPAGRAARPARRRRPGRAAVPGPADRAVRPPGPAAAPPGPRLASLDAPVPSRPPAARPQCRWSVPHPERHRSACRTGANEAPCYRMRSHSGTCSGPRRRLSPCWRGTRCRTGPGRWPRRCRR